MSGKSASLLTKTQRRRLRNDFEDLDETAKRRDQRLIRERIRAGLLDFRLLTNYPDSQLELALEDLPEKELRAALADTYLTVERIRDLHRYDRDQLLQEAQDRAETVSKEATDVRSFDRLDLRTTAEVRRQTEEQVKASHWEKRAIRLVKLAGGAGIGSAFILFVLAFIHRPLHWDYTGIIEEFLLVGFTAAAVLLGVVSVIVISVHALRYDITPALVVIARQFRKLGRTVRRQWEQDRNRIAGDDRTPWWKERKTRRDTSEASMGDESERPLDRLRRRYAAGELTDEQFERKLERLLATETLEDAADNIKVRE